MALLVNGDILSLSIQGTIFGQRTLFTQTFSVQGVDAAIDVTTFLAAWLDNIKSGAPDPIMDHYAAVLSETWVAQKMVAQKVNNPRSVAVEIVQTTPGERPLTTVGYCTAAVTSRTDLGGRDQIATHHIGPIAPGDVVNGLITNDLKTAFEPLLEDMLEATGPAGYPDVSLNPCIWHRSLPGPTVFSDLVTATILQDQARTQRTRRVGHGI